MACLASDCGVGFVESNTIPGVGDDACNTNGVHGFLCIGSIWFYNAALAGAANGDCDRLFIQISDECNMANWLEISSPQHVESANAPVNGVDCCTVGSIWTQTGGADDCECMWVSLGDCEWCMTGYPDGYNDIQIQAGEQIVLAGGLPAVLTEFGTRVQLTVTNPSICHQLNVWREFHATQFLFTHNGVLPTEVFYRIEFSTDGGGIWNSFEFMRGQMTLQPGDTQEGPTGNNVASFTQAIGQVNDVIYRLLVSNPDGNFFGDALIHTRSITVIGNFVR